MKTGPLCLDFPHLTVIIPYKGGNIMILLGSEIAKPSNACLKFQYKDKTVGIWGNPVGLKYLGKLCLELAENPKINHIHFDRANPDDNFLTEDSWIAFISILED